MSLGDVIHFRLLELFNNVFSETINFFYSHFFSHLRAFKPSCKPNSCFFLSLKCTESTLPSHAKWPPDSVKHRIKKKKKGILKVQTQLYHYLLFFVTVFPFCTLAIEDSRKGNSHENQILKKIIMPDEPWLFNKNVDIIIKKTTQRMQVI